MHLRPRRLLALLVVPFALACGKGDGDDAAGTETDFGSGGGDTFTTSHGTTFATTESMTFTNSGDPTSDPSITTSGDPSAGESSEDSGPGTTGPDPDSTGAGPTSDTGESTTEGGSAETGMSGDACCDAHDDGGCGDAAIEACVCATDDFCCETLWDDYCTVQVVLLGCAECANIGGDGDCCAAHGNPGCSDEAVEACVCEMDYLCCTMPWDELCVETASDACAGGCA